RDEGGPPTATAAPAPTAVFQNRRRSISRSSTVLSSREARSTKRTGGWLYHTVLTKVEPCRVGSFVIKSTCRNRALPAIKRSCNSGTSVMSAAAWITAKLIG